MSPIVVVTTAFAIAKEVFKFWKWIRKESREEQKAKIRDKKEAMKTG